MSAWEYLLQPAILFFLLGVLAVIVKSDLEIPDSVLQILSLYLLFALGFKGGTELQNTEFSFSGGCSADNGGRGVISDPPPRLSPYQKKIRGG